MPLIKVTLELCDKCHPGQTDEVMIYSSKKYVEIPKQYCSNCMLQIKHINKEVLVGYLNGS